MMVSIQGINYVFETLINMFISIWDYASLGD